MLDLRFYSIQEDYYISPSPIWITEISCTLYNHSAYALKILGERIVRYNLMATIGREFKNEEN